MNFYSDISSVTEADLERFLQNKVAEGITLDYKEALWGSSEKEKKDFLYDITSLANTEGGVLVVGISEDKQGIPIGLTPVIEANWDAKIRELNQRLLDCVKPRLPGIRFQDVPSSQEGKSYLIIEVPKSWNSPHRADFGGVNRFYGRASRNNYELSVEELRRIFNRHTDMLDRLERFRELRLDKIRSGITPVPLKKFGGIFVLHLVPAQSLLADVSFDLEDAQTYAQKNSMGLGFANPYFNFEGLVGGLGNPDAYDQCTQLNRNGIFEHIVPKIINDGWLHTPTFGSAVYKMCDKFIDFYQSIAITPPFFLLISFLDVKGANILSPEDYFHNTQLGSVIIKQDLKLPRVEISDFLPLEERLRKTRPAFNALWNAIGVPRSPLFKNDGSWQLWPTGA